jgi:hypothetical protein
VPSPGSRVTISGAPDSQRLQELQRKVAAAPLLQRHQQVPPQLRLSSKLPPQEQRPQQGSSTSTSYQNLLQFLSQAPAALPAPAAAASAAALRTSQGEQQQHSAAGLLQRIPASGAQAAAAPANTPPSARSPTQQQALLQRRSAPGSPSGSIAAASPSSSLAALLAGRTTVATTSPSTYAPASPSKPIPATATARPPIPSRPPGGLPPQQQPAQAQSRGDPAPTGMRPSSGAGAAGCPLSAGPLQKLQQGWQLRGSVPAAAPRPLTDARGSSNGGLDKAQLARITKGSSYDSLSSCSDYLCMPLPPPLPQVDAPAEAINR